MSWWMKLSQLKDADDRGCFSLEVPGHGVNHQQGCLRPDLEATLEYHWLQLPFVQR